MSASASKSSKNPAPATSAPSYLLQSQSSARRFSVIDFPVNPRLAFNLGTLHLPGHGPTALQGTLPIFKPYTPPDLAAASVVDAQLQAWVRLVQVPWTKDEIEGPASHIKTAIAAAGYFNPKSDITDRSSVAAAGFCLCIIYLDDILDKTGGFGGHSSSSQRNIFLGTVLDILDGRYSDEAALPRIIPSLDPIYRLMWKAFDYGIVNLPCYSKDNVQWLRKAFMKDSVAALLMKDRSYGEAYSDEVYRLLRPRDGGFYTVMELLLLSRGVIIQNHMRKHPLFKIAMFLSASVLGLTNDMFGLEKEIADGNDNDNLILRIVRGNVHQSEALALGLAKCAARALAPAQSLHSMTEFLAQPPSAPPVSIQQAFEQVLLIVQNQRRDVELTCDKLLDEFTDDLDFGQLSDFVEILQTFLDGHVYFSSYTKRYGEIELNLTY